MNRGNARNVIGDLKEHETTIGSDFDLVGWRNRTRRRSSLMPREDRNQLDVSGMATVEAFDRPRGNERPVIGGHSSQLSGPTPPDNVEVCLGQSGLQQ